MIDTKKASEESEAFLVIGSKSIFYQKQSRQAVSLVLNLQHLL